MRSIFRWLTIWLLYSHVASGQIVSLPYFENFENGLNGWQPSDDGQGTEWNLGTPISGYTTGAYSGDKCWDINLNGFYGSNAQCYLYSPVFDFTNLSIAHISFWTNYRTESLWDYLSVQYSTDNGDSWYFMPFPGLVDPDGATKKWIQSSLDVSDLNGYAMVRFRFMFISDATINFDGYSIDDFAIQTDPLAAPQEPATDLFSMFPNPANGSITIHHNNPSNLTATVSIFDLSGKEINRSQINTYPDSKIEIPSLQPGSYLVSYSVDDATAFKRLLVTPQ